MSYQWGGKKSDLLQPGVFCGAAGEFLWLGKALGGVCTLNTPPCVSPSHPLRVPRGWRGHAAFLPSLGKILLALASSSSCFLHGFQESTLGCTKPPSPELDCSSLVTLLLNNLQNETLPVFIGEAFQVCAADFLPSWRSCRGELPLPVLPASRNRKRDRGGTRGKIPVLHVHFVSSGLSAAPGHWGKDTATVVWRGSAWV